MTLLLQIDTSPPVGVHDEVDGAKASPKNDGVRSVPRQPPDRGKVQQVLPREEGRQDEKPAGEDNWPDWLEATYRQLAGVDWLDVSAVVLAGWLIWLTRGQLRAMEETNRITQESNQITRAQMEFAHRALVGIERIESDIFQPERPVKIEIRVKNFGAGIAQKVCMTTTWRVQAAGPFDPTQPAEEEGKTPEANAVLPPGLALSFDVKGPTLTQQGIKRIGSGRLVFYLSGRITYKDDFSEDAVRLTLFRAMHSQELDRFDAWIFTPEGNRAY